MSLTDPWKHALQWQKLTNFTNQTKIFKLNKTHIYNKIFQKVFLRSRGKSPPPPPLPVSVGWEILLRGNFCWLVGNQP